MGVIEEATELVGLIKKVGDADLYRKIVKLEGEVIELTRANRLYAERIHELEQALKLAGELQFRNGFDWRGENDGPYCTGRWDSKKTANRVVRVQVHSVGPQLQCPVCKHNYGRPGAL